MSSPPDVAVLQNLIYLVRSAEKIYCLDCVCSFLQDNILWIAGKIHIFNRSLSLVLVVLSGSIVFFEQQQQQQQSSISQVSSFPICFPKILSMMWCVTCEC